MDVVNELVRECELSEMLYAGDEAFGVMGWKVNLGETTVLDSNGITKDGMSKS